MSRFRDRRGYSGNVRVDAMPGNSPGAGEVAATGARGIKRDTRGNVIGGTIPGVGAFGTAAGGRPQGPVAALGGGGPAWRQPNNGYVAPVNPAQLTGRQSLFKQMETAGSGGITPEMRRKARDLGVSDGAFNDAAGRIGTNETYSPAKPTPAVPAKPAAPAPAAKSAWRRPLQSNERVGDQSPGDNYEWTGYRDGQKTWEEKPGAAAPAGPSPLQKQAEAARDVGRVLDTVPQGMKTAGVPDPWGDAPLVGDSPQSFEPVKKRSSFRDRYGAQGLRVATTPPQQAAPPAVASVASPLPEPSPVSPWKKRKPYSM